LASDIDSFSSLFILDVATKSQKDHKLFSTTYNLCSKKIGNKKIEGSPFYPSTLSCLKNIEYTFKFIKNFFKLTPKLIFLVLIADHPQTGPKHDGTMILEKKFKRKQDHWTREVFDVRYKIN